MGHRFESYSARSGRKIISHTVGIAGFMVWIGGAGQIFAMEDRGDLQANKDYRNAFTLRAIYSKLSWSLIQKMRPYEPLKPALWRCGKILDTAKAGGSAPYTHFNLIHYIKNSVRC